MEGTTFGDVPLNLELKLEVWDSPNSAGVVIDAVRCCKLALDHGLKGALVAPSAYFKKSPPVQVPDDQARELTEAFIRNPRASHVETAALLGARAPSRNGPAANGAPAATQAVGKRGKGRIGKRPARPSKAVKAQ
jgi:myo-inositol-1-phosphate synthase